MTVLSTTYDYSFTPDGTANPFTIAPSGMISAASFALNLRGYVNWYILNQGGVTGSVGIVVENSATVINAGGITGGIAGEASDDGVLEVTNESTGRIAGGTYAGIYQPTDILTVVNAGIIDSPTGIAGKEGVSLVNSGAITGNAGIGLTASHGAMDVTNTAGAYLYGSGGGIVIGTNGTGTVTNAGTIAGGAGNLAVNLSSAGTLTLVADPGAVFEGGVGGNVYATLDFGAGTATGTFSGLGSEYKGFGHYGVEAGASWTASGNNGFGDNGIVVAGTLAIAGYATGYERLAGGTIDILGGSTIYRFADQPQIGGVDGYVYVAPSATMHGYQGLIGDLGNGQTDTLINAGTMQESRAIALAGYGTGVGITNLSNGTILSGAIDLPGGTLVNRGTILDESGIYSSYTSHSAFKVTYSSPLTVLNSGLIYGYASGLVLNAGGYVSNASTGTIGAGSYNAVAIHTGIYVPHYYSATVVNDGSILGGTVAINAYAGILSVYDAGRVTGAFAAMELTAYNAAAMVAAGGYVAGASIGVAIQGFAGATLTVAGTVAGGQYAVSFDGVKRPGAVNSLVVEPGAAFRGTVDGYGPAYSQIEFGAGIGTLAGFGTQVTNFGQITFDSNAQWLLEGPAAAFSYQRIAGLSAGSTIELTGTIESYGSLVSGELYLTGGTDLYLPGLPFAKVTNDGSNTFITACFASGTRIMGRFGSVPVEALREGDLVRTARGRLAPVRWLGHRRTDLAKHPRPHDVMPVRVHAHAFGPSLPSRDLVLSPDHAVFVRGRLIPIRHLINNVSIVQETRAAITYWHVELDRHDVILAEGLACESYLDTGNRNAFANAPGAVQMTPDFARGVWAARGCAPIITDPADPILRLLHTKLMARAQRAPRAA